MITLRYTLTPVGRFTIAVGPQVANTRPTRWIIPGATVRGALGHAWIHPSSLEEADTNLNSFASHFLAHVQVQQALPVAKSIDQEQVCCGHTCPAATLRHFSLGSCKAGTHIGCPLGADSEVWNRKSFCDGAIGSGRPDSCAQDNPSGWELQKGWEAPPGLIRWTTRSELNADTTPIKGQLFSRALLNDTYQYVGAITCQPDDRETIDWLLQPRSVRMGGQRSTMGLMQWQASIVEEGAPSLTRTNNGDVVLVCQSPAVLVDQWGAATLDLSGYLGQRLNQGQVMRTWVRPSAALGWNGAARLSRPGDLAIEAGSVALIRDASDADLRMLAQGIGTRRGDGYGEVRSATAENPAAADLIRPEHKWAAVTTSTTDATINTLDSYLNRLSRSQKATALRQLADALAGLAQSQPPSAVTIDAMMAQPWAAHLGPQSRKLILNLILGRDQDTNTARSRQRDLNQVRDKLRDAEREAGR